MEDCLARVFHPELSLAISTMDSKLKHAVVAVGGVAF
jgi:hypothetical protein